MQDTHHVGLWRFANEFFGTGKLAMDGKKNDHQDVVIYYLHCHAIELALKALLAYRGYSKDDLKTKIRHDLKLAWKKAIKNGLGDYLTETERAQEVISLLNPYYKTKQFEYITTGFKRYPPVEELHKIAAYLILGVGHAIEIPMPHLSRFHQEIILKMESQ